MVYSPSPPDWGLLTATESLCLSIKPKPSCFFWVFFCFFCRPRVKLLLFKGSSSQIAALWKVCFVLPFHLHTKWGSEWSTGAWPELIWVLMAIFLAWSRKAGCEDIHQRRWPNSLRLRNNLKEIHLLVYTCWDSPAANTGGDWRHLKESTIK